MPSRTVHARQWVRSCSSSTDADARTSPCRAIRGCDDEGADVVGMHRSVTRKKHQGRRRAAGLPSQRKCVPPTCYPCSSTFAIGSMAMCRWRALQSVRVGRAFTCIATFGGRLAKRRSSTPSACAWSVRPRVSCRAATLSRVSRARMVSPATKFSRAHSDDTSDARPRGTVKKGCPVRHAPSASGTRN